jgi:REP element-mobilizing transposase RayT
MARPIRIEFEGALYHVTSRGDRREAIYEDDVDRERFLETLGQVAEQFNWVVHAYCLMSNHYHLLVETPDANLSMGMRQRSSDEPGVRSSVVALRAFKRGVLHC